MTEENQSSSSPIRILLVEDHALTRVGIKTVLKREPDLDVVGEASNGEEAIAQAEALKPDVILMDVGMPVLDGIQASKKIIDSGSPAKIIMLTQHDNEQDILASLAAGASGYCLKDVESARLYMAIRTVHAGDAWLDSSIAGKVLKLYSKNVTPSAVAEQPGAPAAQEKAAQESGHTPAPKAFEPDRPYAEPLSPRELEVLGLIVEGLSNQQISDRLIISLPTTKTHVRNILNKLAVDDRTQAAVHAMRRGIV
ncbi:MAG: response regulator transcription factor [Candidatus Obscuribacterales bacterium]|nr:response regulator transcription factor [Candidatus Obscuribacterales bacterium]